MHSRMVSKKSLVAGLAAGGTAMMLSSMATAAPMSYETAVQGDSPFAYYRLNETSGTTADDSSVGGSNDGTYINSPTLGVTGAGTASDNAVSFDGSDQYTDLTDLGSFGSNMNNSTYEFVVRYDATPSNGDNLFGTFNNSSNTAVQFQKRTSDSQFYLRDEDNQRTIQTPNDDDPVSNSVGGLYDGDYHHLAITYDAPNDSGETVADSSKIYVDGVDVGETNIPSDEGADNFADYQYNQVLAAYNARGTIAGFSELTLDEAAFYTSTLSQTQVQAHNSALAAVPEPASLALMGIGGLVLLSGRSRGA